MYVIRSDHSKCCVWCSKLAVKDAYPEFNWRKGAMFMAEENDILTKLKKAKKLSVLFAITATMFL